MQERSIDTRIAIIASRQYGVFAREQVLEMGIKRSAVRHRLGNGRWKQLARGVYKLAGSPASWPQSLMVACLAWGPGAKISHCSAAPWWEFAGYSPGPIELTVPPGRRRQAPGKTYGRVLAPRDATTFRCLPVTTPARTLVDIAAVSLAENVEEALDDALRRELVSIAGLRRNLHRWERSRLPGTTTLRTLVNARDGAMAPPRSLFETRLLRLMKRAGLPHSVRQYPLWKDGHLIAILDFAFVDARLGIEADGYQWHSGRIRWEKDRTRQNELTLLGWRIIHVTWRQLVSEPHKVIDSITTALRPGP